MPDYYAIHIKGAIDPRWSAWFEGLTVSHTATGDTLLRGSITDQAALYGLIGKLRDLGLTLLSITATGADLHDRPVDDGT